MSVITLKKIEASDKKYFSVWWRDKDLVELTSGDTNPISDQEIDQYFQSMLDSKTDNHFMIAADKEIIGHISLSKRENDWYEIQIVIGQKEYWSQGYGTAAIKLLIDETMRLGASKIYLEVRPTNIRAIGAYENCGFKRINIISHPKDNRLPETLRMELQK
jgi:aminoglycoside 6'-N-acetyltransferase